MIRKLKWISFLACLLTLGCGGEGSAAEIGADKESALRAREVGVSAVVRQDFNRTLESTGSLIPKDRARLRALVEGPLESVFVDIGDSVQKGQALYKTRPVDSRLAVESAQAALRTSRASLSELLAGSRSEEIDVLRAEAAQAEAEYHRLRNERDRAASLLERGAISTSAWEQARTAFETAEAQVEISRERLLIAETGPTKEAIEVAENKVTEKEAALAQAQQKLEDTSVKAPFDGVITGKYLNAGDYVRRGDEVLEITDLSYLEAEMKAPERYADLMKAGIPVTLRIESLLTRRKGQIVAVNDSIDMSTRTFLVKVGIDNADHSIKAGTFFTGVFQLEPLRDAIAIPTVALRQEGGRSFVWVADSGSARQQIVVSGEQTEEYVQIRSGLSGDEKVVVEGAGALSEGDPLQIISPSE